MVECAVATWERLRLSQFSDKTARHAPLDEFGSIRSVPKFRLFAAFSIPPVRALRYIFGAVQDRAGVSGGAMRRRCFCAVA